MRMFISQIVKLTTIRVMQEGKATLEMGLWFLRSIGVLLNTVRHIITAGCAMIPNRVVPLESGPGILKMSSSSFVNHTIIRPTIEKMAGVLISTAAVLTVLCNTITRMITMVQVMAFINLMGQENLKTILWGIISVKTMDWLVGTEPLIFGLQIRQVAFKTR